MNNFSRIVFRNSAVGLVAQFAIKILSFTFSVFIVRRLGAQEFGQYAAVAAFGTIFLFISDLGLSPYMVRQVARMRDLPDGSERIKTLYGNILILRLLLSVVAGIFLLSAAWLTGRPLVMIGAIALNTLGIFMYGAQGTYDGILSGYERVDLSARAKLYYQMAFIALGSVALWRTTGYYGLIVANLASIGIYTLICWRWVRDLGVLPSRASWAAWLPLLRLSLPFAIISFALGLSYKFDSVLLNIFRSDLETGYYNSVYNLVFSAVLISNVINTSLYPSLTRQVAINPARLSPIVMRVLRYLITISLPISMGVWALADKLVTFLYTSSYRPAVPALRIIIWVAPFMFLSEFLGYVVLINGREKIAARSVVISTGFNVVLNLWVVPHFGFIGAAVMTVATEAVLVGQYFIILFGLLRNMNWVHIFVRPLLATIFMGMLVVLLRPYIPFPADIVIGAGSYLLFLFLFRVIGQDDLRFVREVRTPLDVDTSS
jgi:O-antigen/teichoic acid export membrane protein